MRDEASSESLLRRPSRSPHDSGVARGLQATPLGPRRPSSAPYRITARPPGAVLRCECEPRRVGLGHGRQRCYVLRSDLTRPDCFSCSLSDNRISDAGATALGEALKINKALAALKRVPLGKYRVLSSSL